MIDRRRNQGFSLVGTVFLIVVLAAAGAMMVKVSGVQRSTTNYALLGARAFHAARSGIEWAAYQAVDSGSCAASSSFSLTEGGLRGFDLDVTCTAVPHTEVGIDTIVYSITSEAERGTFGSRDYGRRRLEATLAIPGP